MSKDNSSPRLINRRIKRRLKSKKSWQSRISSFAKIIAIGLSTILAIGILWLANYYSKISIDLPSIESIPILLDGPNGQLYLPTRIYDRTGEHLLQSLENPNSINSIYIPLNRMPKLVVEAILGVMDPGFWDHSGYYFSLDLSSPTFAQILAGDLLLWGETSGTSKSLRQSFLAAQITEQFGKEKVLEWYLNSADFGQLAFGIDEAAWVYFGKSALDLTLAESAMLAAVVEAPALNPIDAPEVAIERQGKVLQFLLNQGLIDINQATEANQIPIQIQKKAEVDATIAPEYLDILLDQLFEKFGKDRVYRGGLKVISTLDYQLQKEVNCSIETQLGRLKGTLNLDQIVENCESARLLPRLGREQISENSSLDASVVVLDSTTGQILALTGDVKDSNPPGTILTPFIYMTAFTRGMSPATLLWDIPNNFPPLIESSNLSEIDFQGPASLRTALANDYIAPAMQTLTQIGPANAWRTAQQSGIKNMILPSNEDTYRMILDQGRINLLELTHAYSMLSNQGTLAGQIPINSSSDSPGVNAILQVNDNDGRVLFDQKIPATQGIVTNQVAYLITDILSDDLARQSSLGHPNPLETGRPSASKIGHTIDNNNAWTVGYSPQRVVGVWLGTPDSSLETPGIAPSIAAAGLWNAIIKATYSGLPFENWVEPPGLNNITVCDPSGLLPTEECLKLVTELFISGSEPLQQDNLYKSILINTQTERLATVYSPSEFVEERVYMFPPPNAVEWARTSGLDIPPTSYDVIFNVNHLDGPAVISSPEIFSYISGVVSIDGIAKGNNFSYYRLQIGEGLNPRQWLQIGDNYEESVNLNELTTWDTRGLNGLYAIQLLVVNQDQTVETAIVQVTVDNQAPDIQISVPLDNQIFPYSIDNNITIQAQIGDNLGVDSVQIFVDNRLISTLTDPPFVAPWNGLSGDHKLKVIATDLAGNKKEVLVNFIID